MGGFFETLRPDSSTNEVELEAYQHHLDGASVATNYLERYQTSQLPCRIPASSSTTYASMPIYKGFINSACQLSTAHLAYATNCLR